MFDSEWVQLVDLQGLGEYLLLLDDFCLVTQSGELLFIIRQHLLLLAGIKHNH